MHHNPISVQAVSYTYPDGTPALQDINFFIHATERVALIGANGSGKSTLLQHLNGLIMPQVGTVRIGDLRLESANLKAIRNFVGFVFQNPDNQLFMPSVWEDVTFGPQNQGIRGDALTRRAELALWAVGLDPVQFSHRIASNLSGGEKKRVAIAGVLAMEPQALVLDEPTAQLDPRSRRQLIRLLASLPHTQLIATHDLDLALELCDRTILLSNGRIICDGDTPTILGNADLLEEYALEQPLSYSRPYCLLEHSPLA